MKTEIRPEKEMKDSGIEYVGEIPKDWDLERLRVYFCERKNKNREGNEDNLLSLSYGRIIRKNIDKTDGLLPASFNTYNIVEKNDIIIRPTDLQNDKRSLRTGLVTEHGIITSAYIDLMPIGTVDSKFFHYLLHSYDILKVFYNMGSGVRQGLNYSEFSKLKVPIPPLSEQQAIAGYLDEVCFKIGEIIAEVKASIEEYKELKQAVIFEAVTKGIENNVEMKDSGNLAIGKIPKHWVKARVKNVATRITVGVVVTPANYFDDTGTVAFLRGINVKEYVINSEPMMYITKETNTELSKTIVHTNDLVIVRDGAIGVTAVVPKKYDGANVVSMIIVSLGSEYNHDYLCYVLNSYVGKIQFNLTKIGSALSHTSVSSVSNIEIPKPSISEQIDIVNYLKGQHKKLDSLIAEKESLINDLEAYKKSLIYELVTGKRRVV